MREQAGCFSLPLLYPAVGPWSWTPVDYIREEKQFTWYIYYCLKGLERYD